MSEQYEIAIEIDHYDPKTSRSLAAAITPDTLDTPNECRVQVDSSKRIRIIISCKRINLLRALLNSYLSVMSMILHCLEVLEYESTETPTRGPTDSD